MNIISARVIIFFTFLFCSTFIFPQQEIDSTKTYVITQNDGSQLTGKILKNDEHRLAWLRDRELERVQQRALAIATHGFPQGAHPQRTMPKCSSSNDDMPPTQTTKHMR
jgi:hypothetical protein